MSTLQECGINTLTYARRTHNCDDHRRRLDGCTVYHRHMELLFTEIIVSSDILLGSSSALKGEGLGVAGLFSIAKLVFLFAFDLLSSLLFDVCFLSSFLHVGD